MTSPLVSIVIRARDEERMLGRTLDMIGRQTVGEHEVLLVDSGSRDRTIQIAERAGVRILHLEQHRFTYGRALNVGAAAARGRFLVNLSAHAVPVDAQWLAALLEAFDTAAAAGHQVAGVFGRQAPMPDATPVVAREYVECYGDEFRISATDPFFSNSNALIPRALWQEAPFDERLTYCEDMAWMAAQQCAGRVVVYAPAAAVLHSHNDSLRQVYRRSRNEGAALGSITGERWSPLSVAGAWLHEVRADQRYCAEQGIGWWQRARWIAPAYRLVKLLGGYAGRAAGAPEQGRTS